MLTCLQDLARAEETAAEIRRGGRGGGRRSQVDVRKPEEVKALADRVAADFGGADILVNNAGVIKDALFPFMKEEDWDYVLDVDLKGAFRVTQRPHPGHAPQDLRPDHQHRLGQRDLGPRRPGQLLGGQGRADRVHEGAGPGARAPRRSPSTPWRPASSTRRSSRT